MNSSPASRPQLGPRKRLINKKPIRNAKSALLEECVTCEPELDRDGFFARADCMADQASLIVALLTSPLGLIRSKRAVLLAMASVGHSISLPAVPTLHQISAAASAQLRSFTYPVQRSDPCKPCKSVFESSREFSKISSCFHPVHVE